MDGLHLFADLYTCRCPEQFLLHAPKLEALCLAACRQHGFTIVGSFFHQFTATDLQPAGVTGTVVLAESHLALHTWPEIACATLDVYICNFSADNSQSARQLCTFLIETFQPEQHTINEIARGRPKQVDKRDQEPQQLLQTASNASPTLKT